AVLDAGKLLSDQLLFEANGNRDDAELVDFTAVLHGLSDEFGAIYHRQIELEVSSELPLLVAERRRVEQVLSSLLHNACRHAPSSRLGVRAQPYEHDPGSSPSLLPNDEQLPVRLYLYFVIWDHGPGIPPDERERVFAPFYRLQRDSDYAAGLGLGLYV